jgi:hypothetical protein
VDIIEVWLLNMFQSRRIAPKPSKTSSEIVISYMEDRGGLRFIHDQLALYDVITERHRASPPASGPIAR